MEGLSDLVVLRIITCKADDILKQLASRRMTVISFYDDGGETLFEYSPSFMDERMLAKLGLGLNGDGRLERWHEALEHERGLARTRHAGYGGEFAAGDVHFERLDRVDGIDAQVNRARFFGKRRLRGLSYH